METKLLILGFLFVGLFISGCTSITQTSQALGLPGANCTSTADCQQNLICLNNVCRIPPSCREANQACSVDSDCCSGLRCSNYKCVSSSLQPSPQPGISENDSAAYWGGADIGIAWYYINVYTAFLYVRNNRPFQINLTGITLDGSGTMSPSSVLISPGSYSLVKITTTCGSDGTPFSKNVVITYIDATYGTTYTFTGEKPLVGSCQVPRPIPPQPVPTQCTFPPGFSCRSFKLHAGTSELDLFIGQGTGHQIKITGVTCTGNLSSAYPVEASINNYATEPIFMNSGSHQYISRSGTFQVVRCTDANGNLPSSTQPGSIYSGGIYINYTETDTELQRIVVGTLIAKWED